jgi:hypothetical protein
MNSNSNKSLRAKTSGRSRWWENSAVASAFIGLVGAITGAVIASPNIPGFQVFGGHYDYPTVNLLPRNEFCFWHQNTPTGYRLFTRHSDGTWIETQPDNIAYHHKELGRVRRGPFHGVILSRVENPPHENYPVQLFVPDSGAGNVLMYRPDEKNGWEYAGVLTSTVSNCPRKSERPG